jgi:glycosyltransferase involved in cell wall biosynthesis
VLHVTLGLEVGGQEKLLVGFARHADRERFDLRVVAIASRGPVAAEIEALGCPVTALAERPGLRPGLVLRLATLFRQLRPDVVHTHDIKPLLYAAPAARLVRVRTLIHTKHYGTVPQLSQRQVMLGNLAGRIVDAFVCVSEDGARQTIAQGLAAERVRVIHNGIDLARYPCRGPATEGPVTTVARLSPEKDVDTLLRAALRVAKQLPEFRLAIAGDGPCRANLEQLRDDLGLQQVVTFLGEISDVSGLLARSRLFVLPSRTEGISLTILEAMASGLPVVGTRVGGNPEVVADEATGRLVRSGDPAGLADAIVASLQDADESRRMGLAGRRRVEQHFDIRRMVADYEALYRQAPRVRRVVSSTEGLVLT